MRLAEALPPLPPGPGRVIALVGAGGKTSALFGLGEDLALGPARARVLLTTTTHIYDPRLEDGRGFDRLVLAPDLADPAREPPGPLPRPAPAPCRVVLAAGEEPGTGKLRGIHPDHAARLALAWDYVILEADGAKRLPVKAPAGHEPVLPPASGLVLGFVGLACLGRPMDGRTVHRPERFGPLTGCAPGAPITLDHLATLARSPQGLFQGAPAGARRVLVLNQADLCPEASAALAERLAGLGLQGVDRVLVCVLGAARPEARVVRVQAL
jgi:probable selenium-dependent hydroxylase accessory protein YqeC